MSLTQEQVRLGRSESKIEWLLKMLRDLTAEVRRVAQTVRVLDQAPGSGGVPGAPADSIWIRKAKTGGSGIAVASAVDTPTFAAVTLGAWNPATGKWTTTALTVPAANVSTTQTVGINTWVTIGWVTDGNEGYWEVILEPC